MFMSHNNKTKTTYLLQKFSELIQKRIEVESNETMEKVLVEFRSYLNKNIFVTAKTFWNLLVSMLRLNKQSENAMEMVRENQHFDPVQELKELKAAVEIVQAELTQLNERILKIYEAELNDNEKYPVVAQIGKTSVAESGDNGVLQSKQENNDQIVGDEADENNSSVSQTIQEAAQESVDEIVDNIEKTTIEAEKNDENMSYPALETAENAAIDTIEICTSESENRL